MYEWEDIGLVLISPADDQRVFLFAREKIRTVNRTEKEKLVAPKLSVFSHFLRAGKIGPTHDSPKTHLHRSIWRCWSTGISLSLQLKGSGHFKTLTAKSHQTGWFRTVTVLTRIHCRDRQDQKYARDESFKILGFEIMKRRGMKMNDIRICDF